MNNFGKKNVYYSESEMIEPRGGCNCGAICSASCSCSCSGGFWVSYSQHDIKGLNKNVAHSTRKPTGI